jgi:hypothetical protein
MSVHQIQVGIITPRLTGCMALSSETGDPAAPSFQGSGTPEVVSSVLPCSEKSSCTRAQRPSRRRAPASSDSTSSIRASFARTR